VEKVAILNISVPLGTALIRTSPTKQQDWPRADGDNSPVGSQYSSKDLKLLPDYFLHA
jgi:hypothetical protein